MRILVSPFGWIVEDLSARSCGRWSGCVVGITLNNGDGLRMQGQSAPNIEMHGEELSQADESTLYHHFEMNYTPPGTESGRRLARR